MQYDEQQLDARLYKRGRRYWLWGYDANGQRWWESTKQTTRTAARKAAKTIDERRAIPTDPLTQAAAALTLERALADLDAEGTRRAWKPATVTFKRKAMRHVLDVLGRDTLTASLTLSTLNDYLDARLKQGRGDLGQRHTIFKEVQVLIQALKHAAEHKRYFGTPSELMPKSLRKKAGRYKPGSGWLRTTAECEALIAAFEELFGRGLDVVAYLNIGVRRSELWTIKPSDVHDLDTATPWVKVWGTKTEKAERTVSLNRTMVEVMRRKLDAAEAWDAPLFAPVKNVDRMLKQAWKQARFRLLTAAPTKEERSKLDATLPRSVCCNDLRRTFVSTLCRAGVPAHACADLLGHASTDMVLSVYRQVDPQSLHDAVARMPAMALPAPVTLHVTGKQRKAGLAA
jgi:integrase